MRIELVANELKTEKSTNLTIININYYVGNSQRMPENCDRKKRREDKSRRAD